MLFSIGTRGHLPSLSGRKAVYCVGRIEPLRLADIAAALAAKQVTLPIVKKMAIARQGGSNVDCSNDIARRNAGIEPHQNVHFNRSRWVQNRYPGAENIKTRVFAITSVAFRAIRVLFFVQSGYL